MANQNFLNEDGLQIYDLLIKNLISKDFNTFYNNETVKSNEREMLLKNALQAIIASYQSYLKILGPSKGSDGYYSYDDMKRLASKISEDGSFIDLLSLLPSRSDDTSSSDTSSLVKFKKTYAINPVVTYRYSSSYNYSSGSFRIDGDTSPITEQVEWIVLNYARTKKEDSSSYPYYYMIPTTYFYTSDDKDQRYESYFKYGNFSSYKLGCGKEFEQFFRTKNTCYVAMAAPLSVGFRAYSSAYAEYYETGEGYGYDQYGHQVYQNCFGSDTGPSNLRYNNGCGVMNCLASVMQDDFIYGLRFFTKYQLQKAVEAGFYNGQTFSNVLVQDRYRTEKQTVEGTSTWIIYEVICTVTKSSPYSNSLTYDYYNIPLTTGSVGSNSWSQVDIDTYKAAWEAADPKILLLGQLGIPTVSADKIEELQNTMSSFTELTTF